MKYRQFNTAIWSNDYVSELNDKEFKAFMFYDKNERVNMCGIYEIEMKLKMFFLNMKKDEILEIEKKFESDRIYFFFKNWVYLPNDYLENQYSSADPILKAVNKELSKVPCDVKEHFFDDLGLVYIPPFDLKKVSLHRNRNEMVMKLKGNEKRDNPTLPNNTDVMNENINAEDIPEWVGDPTKDIRKLLGRDEH